MHPEERSTLLAIAAEHRATLTAAIEAVFEAHPPQHPVDMDTFHDLLGGPIIGRWLLVPEDCDEEFVQAVVRGALRAVGCDLEAVG